MGTIKNAIDTPSTAVILGLDPRIYCGRRVASRSLAANCRGPQIIGSSPRMTAALMGEPPL